MRFFITSQQLLGETLALGTEDAQHISRVLRMRPGDELTVCCDDGMTYRCALQQADKQGALARILHREPSSGEPSALVTVYAGLSKGDRFDYLIQKCVECGVSRIVPFTSRYCVVRLEKGDGEKKRQRYARIALEASKQCGRARPVEVGEIVPFSQALSQAKESACGLFLYEKEQQRSLSALLRGSDPRGSFSVVTGPEGGFSPEEAALAEEMGLHCVSIGPRILRCETAPVAAVCAIMYQTGNFDIGV